MKSLIKFKILFLVLLTQLSMGQTNENFIKISEKLESYFSLKREVISVQFNKSTYLTNEKIWFKGYVLDRKTKKLDSSTTNVYFQLFNDKGEEISKQLLFCFNGTFIGDQILDLKLASGKYYARFFTNYMNNFKEDESSVYEIEIINPFNYDDYSKNIQSHDLKINYFPESGKIIQNTKNQLTLKLNDCLGSVIRNQEIILTNQKDEIIQKTTLNGLGIGKLEFIPLNNEKYKLKTIYQGITFEKPIENIDEKGINLTVNNITLKGKCLIQISTNEATLSSLLDQKMFIVVHQDEKAVIFEKKWDDQKTEQLLVIDNNDLADGINTVRVLDSNLNEISSRNIYKNPENIETNFNLHVEKTTDDKNLLLRGINSINESNMSVTILPLNSLAKTNNHSIISDLLITPYMVQKQPISGQILKKMDRLKSFDLDVLICQNSKQKYSWNDILEIKIEEKYKDEIGINIQGEISSNLNKKEKFKVQLYSFELNINEFSDIDNDNQFRFDNLILTDSTYLSFNLVKNFSEKSKIKAVFNIENNKGIFNKKIAIESFDCKFIENKKSPAETHKKPIIIDENVIELENVEVFASKTEQMLMNRVKNPTLRGTRITDDTPLTQMGVLYFLERNGFVVDQNPSRPVTVQTRNANATSINGASSRAMLFINDIQYRDYEILRDILLGDIDEIYLSTTHLEPSVTLYVGKIVIYTKGGKLGNSKRVSTNTDFVIKNGFSPRNIFKNNQYQSTNDDGFENYGVIHWEPFLEQKDGTYSMQFNALGRDKFFVQIEGITNDGKLISIQQLLN